jgi:Tol biopolymer transport system component
MRRNQWIMIAASIVAVLIISAYFVWNNSRLVTGNVVPHTKNQIAYRTGPWEAGRGDINILDTATGAVTQLTKGRNFSNLRWSPDGESLFLTAFTAKQISGSYYPETYLLSVSTDKLKPADADLSNAYGTISLSPDGKQILESGFDSFDPGEDNSINQPIFLRDVGRSDRKQIATGVDPAWSPDGTQIAFASKQGSDTDSDIYIMNADGSNQRRLLQNSGKDLQPLWSFDGKYIAFSTVPENGRRYVTVTDLQGKMTATFDVQDFPVWSPATDQLAYSDGTHPVCVADPDGGDIQCTPAQDAGLRPQWSPDGKQVVFDNGQNICIFNLEKGNVSCFEQAVGIFPVWRP